MQIWPNNPFKMSVQRSLPPSLCFQIQKILTWSKRGVSIFQISQKLKIVWNIRWGCGGVKLFWDIVQKILGQKNLEYKKNFLIIFCQKICLQSFLVQKFIWFNKVLLKKKFGSKNVFFFQSKNILGKKKMLIAWLWNQNFGLKNFGSNKFGGKIGPRIIFVK